ncbi:uncharacterized protein BX664DRAFT_326788 [Halteromyces radiatus]|uniref:uncharacterized protein n=1 Tax=Halteromyces radiatus TaxID=101107 RepID=UPI00222073A7|nr:uncharacterized protein BX664DRAFT_326788 [Halteromyces radiatus]KAI8097606.1 hypothetical protein BX664DRAFT_326788 [Halteromyces radiatus]
MTRIELIVSHASRSECLSITNNIHWVDLRDFIFESFKISVTQVFYRDIENDIITLSTDSELNSLKQQCTTGIIHLYIDPLQATQDVFDNTIQLHSRLEKTNEKTPIEDDKIRTNHSFATQFEQFGKLMDRYQDLFQKNPQAMKRMHQVATQLIFRQSTVDLTVIEDWLEQQNISSTTTKSYRSSLPPSMSLFSDMPSSTDLHGKSSNIIPKISSSATSSLPSSSSPSSSSSSSRLSTSNLPSNDKEKNQLWNNIQSVAPDELPPSYDDHMSSSSHHHSEEKKRINRRHTHYGYLSEQSIPTSSWGEWPAYSSLHPPPTASPPSTYTTDHHSSYQPSRSSHLSLYPRPPILPTILKQTSRILSHWMPPLPSSSATINSSSSRHPIETFSIAKDSSRYRDDGDNMTNTTDRNKKEKKQKERQHENGTNDDGFGNQFLERRRERQLCKEQHKALRGQQKELERTMRHLRRLEKRERKEQRRNHRYTLQSVDLRRKSSVTSLSSLSSSSSSISTCSSVTTLSNDIFDQQRQQKQNATYPPIPSSYIWDKSDHRPHVEPSTTNEMTVLTDTFQQLQTTNDKTTTEKKIA